MRKKQRKTLDRDGVQLRLPADQAERADALADDLYRYHPELRAAMRLSRAAVLRLAIVKGLDYLEADLAKRRKEAQRAVHDRPAPRSKYPITDEIARSMGPPKGRLK